MMKSIQERDALIGKEKLYQSQHEPSSTAHLRKESIYLKNQIKSLKIEISKLKEFVNVLMTNSSKKKDHGELHKKQNVLENKEAHKENQTYSDNSVSELPTEFSVDCTDETLGNISHKSEMPMKKIKVESLLNGFEGLENRDKEDPLLGKGKKVIRAFSGNIIFTL